MQPVTLYITVNIITPPTLYNSLPSIPTADDGPPTEETPLLRRTQLPSPNIIYPCRITSLSKLSIISYKIQKRRHLLAPRRCPFRPLRSIGPFNNATHYCHRNMRMINFGLIAVLSCIAVIGATSVSNRASAGDITRFKRYVPYAVVAHRGSDLIEKSFSSRTCSELLTLYNSCINFFASPRESCFPECDAYNVATECKPQPPPC